MKRVPRKPAGDFSELERAFFEAAPPEIPVVPAEALRFDDLDLDLDDRSRVPARLERRRRPRVERRRARPERSPSELWTHFVGARLVAAGRAVREATSRWSRVAWASGRAWAGPHAERMRRRFVAGLSTVRASLGRRARATLARLADELPGERLTSKTLAASVAFVVFVVIAAGVVAQRPALSAPRAEPTTLIAP